MKQSWLRRYWLSRVAVFLFSFSLLSATALAQPQTPPDTDNQQMTEYRLAPDQLQKAKALYRIRVAHLVGGIIFTIIVLAALIQLRVGARCRAWAEAISHRRILQALVFCPLLLLTFDVLMLPLAAHRHYLSVAYGLSVQNWGSWLWDWTKGELLMIFVLTLTAWGGYVLIRRSPRRWWLYTWMASLPVMVVLVFLSPLVIEPMFDRFEPLSVRQPQLVAEIEKVVRRGGLTIPPERIFEMKASEKVTTYNAYVSGVGVSKRVVVWDTTARDLTVPQTLSVFGHETGHYVMHHIWQGLAFAAMATLIGLWMSYWLVNWVLTRWGRQWQIRDVGDWASLPVFILVFTILSLLGQPAASAFSRHLEHQADIYGLEVTHGLVPDSSQASAQAFQKMGENGLTIPNPNPLLVFWFTIIQRWQVACASLSSTGRGTTDKSLVS
ncbi:MAG TPA: M48 family metallopeptidase [Clostridia bacterium]|nr:M48 family metallopeptidase [Clostridia bacterium]